MKNIDKYPNTANALEAYAAYKGDSIGGVPFERWLEDEYVEPPPPTLIDVAEELSRDIKAVRDTVGSRRSLSHDLIDRFIDAVDREKRKPLRNCDKYTDLAEAKHAFNKHCSRFNENCYEINDRRDNKPTPRCPLSGLRTGEGECFPMWLYMVCKDTKKE